MALRYQVNADTTQFIQAPAPSFMQSWPRNWDFIDNPDVEVLFVRSRAITKIFCLLEDFIVHDEVVCAPKFSSASSSAPPLAPMSMVDPVDVVESGGDIPLEESLQDMDSNDRPFE